MSLDELIEFDVELDAIQEAISKTNEEIEDKVDWAAMWGKKYPILVRYQHEVNIPNYAYRIGVMLDELKREYQYSEQDAMLALKDILYKTWKERKNTK